MTTSYFKTGARLLAVTALCLQSHMGLAYEFAGGSGEPNDPYRIATVEQLISIGSDPNLLDRHYLLIADVNLVGRVFSKALIGPQVNQASSDSNDPVDGGFSGRFDGNGLTISNLTVKGSGYLGLFGVLETSAEVRNLGVADANVVGSGDNVGALVGKSYGSISNCYSTGQVGGRRYSGGLIGNNCGGLVANCHSAVSVGGRGFGDYVGGLAGCNSQGRVIECYSTGAVKGDEYVGGLIASNAGQVVICCSTALVSGQFYAGGLVGFNDSGGELADCYSTGAVGGKSHVGGLVGCNKGIVADCHSMGAVSGVTGYSGTVLYVGGLAGGNAGGSVINCYSTGQVSGQLYAGGLLGYSSSGSVTCCYSAGSVSGTGDHVGGLVGYELPLGSIGSNSFWDIQASGQATSHGGIGKTTAEMKITATFVSVGWDFVGEIDNGTKDVWWILEGWDYPRLRWEITRMP